MNAAFFFFFAGILFGAALVLGLAFWVAIREEQERESDREEPYPDDRYYD